jgi:ubiquitin-like protein Pup
MAAGTARNASNFAAEGFTGAASGKVFLEAAPSTFSEVTRMAQEQVQKKKSQVSDSNIEDSSVDVTNPELDEKTSQVVDDIDDVLEEQLDLELLDAMDEVLEEDAETFVNNYIQKGGE